MIDISAALAQASKIRRPLHGGAALEFVCKIIASVGSETDWDQDAGERWAWTADASFPNYACIYAPSPLVFCSEGLAFTISNTVEAEVLEVPDINAPWLSADARTLIDLFENEIAICDGENPASGIDPTKFSVQELYFWTV